MNDKELLEFGKQLDNCKQCRSSKIKSFESFIFYHLRDHNLQLGDASVGVLPTEEN